MLTRHESPSLSFLCKPSFILGLKKEEAVIVIIRLVTKDIFWCPPSRLLPHENAISASKNAWMEDLMRTSEPNNLANE
jgi:hypothetical protein